MPTGGKLFPMNMTLLGSPNSFIRPPKDNKHLVVCQVDEHVNNFFCGGILPRYSLKLSLVLIIAPEF